MARMIKVNVPIPEDLVSKEIHEKMTELVKENSVLKGKIRGVERKLEEQKELLEKAKRIVNSVLEEAEDFLEGHDAYLDRVK